jgi:cell fate regulator YaaT (PSP1 superfamily)
MDFCEYLVSYGRTGDFGRFRLAQPIGCRRGDRVVVRSHRGLELGEVLCPATPGHAQFLPNTTVGALLRLAGDQDEQAAERQRQRGRQLCDDGRRLAGELALPLEILDAEILLDGQQAIVQFLRWDECDFRPFVSALSTRYEVQLAMHDLALPGDADAEQEEHGCGREDCGRAGGKGSCASCGSGGGCSGCGVAKKEDLAAYFAGLRQQMDARQRTALL